MGCWGGGGIGKEGRLEVGGSGIRLDKRLFSRLIWKVVLLCWIIISSREF